MDTLVILSKEFMLRVNMALGEIQAKFAIPVINELQAWADKAETDSAKLLADVEKHLAPHRAIVASTAAAAESAAAANIAAKSPVPA
jgi:hypothetical protein